LNVAVAVMQTLAIAGIVAPLWFTALVLLQSLMQPDYSHVALPISALAAWPAGWLQNLNFIGFGLLMSAYALGLHRSLRPMRGGGIGLALLLVSGAGIVLAGVFAWSRVGADFVVPTGHLVAAVMSFLGAALGFIVMARRMAGDPRWRDIAGYTAVSGVAMLVLFVVVGRLAMPDEAPLHRWAGLGQRLIVLVWFACTIRGAVRLLGTVRKRTPA
jgi:hypothetical membrane protein